MFTQNPSQKAGCPPCLTLHSTAAAPWYLLYPCPCPCSVQCFLSLELDTQLGPSHWLPVAGHELLEGGLMSFARASSVSATKHMLWKVGWSKLALKAAPVPCFRGRGKSSVILTHVPGREVRGASWVDGEDTRNERKGGRYSRKNSKCLRDLCQDQKA